MDHQAQKSIPPPPDAAPDDVSYAAEIGRKALHLIALVVPLGMWWLGKPVALFVVVPMALAAVAADVLRARSVGFHAFIERYFGFMMRETERPVVGGPVTINGATWVLVSAALVGVIFPLHIAVPAFAMFMLADAAAALVGRRIGRHRWPGGTRTLEGSLAFFVTGLGFLLFFPGLVLWVSVASVGVAAIAEAMPGPFNDNIRVPLVAATVIFVLERFVLGLEPVLFF